MIHPVNINAIRELISFPKNISILSHRNPDGDALGSTLALSHYLQGLGHQVQVIMPSEYPLNFEWLPQANQIITYDLSPKQAEDWIKASQLIFLLDFNSLDRIDKMGLWVQESSAPKVMIDHHIEPEPIADVILSEDWRSSTSEMVYIILSQLGREAKFSDEIDKCIYTGILTDTGSFHHNTSPELYRLVADMKERGLQDGTIQEMVNNSQPDRYLQLLGHCLYNRMELLPDIHAGYIYLTREDYKKFDIQRGDTEGIINYLMMLKSVRVGVLVMHQPSIIKLSMRSKGDINVQMICRKYFNGGGHKNASGGSSKVSLEDTLSHLKTALRELAGT